MKSSNHSFVPVRRAFVAAAVLATGSLFAQSSSASDGDRAASRGGNDNFGEPAGSTSTSESTRRKEAQYGTGSSSQTGSSQYGTSSSQQGTGSSQYGSSSQSGSSQYSSPSPTGGASQYGSTSQSSSSAKLSWTDRRFVTKAAENGQQELQLAQLAAQRASNPDVKQFAQQMVNDHSRVNSQLMSIASSKNVKIDQEDNRDRTYRRLSNASGNEFDREFVEHMVDQHESDVKMFEKASRNAKDPEVRQFASNTLQHLRQHLSHVQQLQQSIVPTGRMDDEDDRSSTSGSSSGGMSGTSSGGMGTTGSSQGTVGSGGSNTSSSGWGTSGAGTSNSDSKWGTGSSGHSDTSSGSSGSSGSSSSGSSSGSDPKR